MERSKVSLQTNGAAFILLAVMLLVLPLQWIGAALLAAALHELAHAGAVYLCGARVNRIRIGLSGAAMESLPLTRPQALFCTLAGPLAGLMLLPLAKWLPRTAICAAFQSFYNLLPVYPLDGGRAVLCICQMLFSEGTAQRICTALTYLICIAIAALAFCAVFVWKLGLLPALFAAMTVFRIHQNAAKIPCKAAKHAVQ